MKNPVGQIERTKHATYYFTFAPKMRLNTVHTGKLVGRIIYNSMMLPVRSHLSFLLKYFPRIIRITYYTAARSRY